MATVVIAVSDLLFQSRISAAVSAAGAGGVVADSAAAVESALAAKPALVIVDLHDRGVVAMDVIRAGATSGARVLAFGRHTEPALLREARLAGADRVVPRSQLAEELPQLLASSLDEADVEPTRTPTD